MPTIEITTVAAITRAECDAVFLSPDLSRSTRLVTALAASLDGKMSRHQGRAGVVARRLECVSDLQQAVRRRTGHVVPVILTREAGLDGVRLHRAWVAAGDVPRVSERVSCSKSYAAFSRVFACP